MIRIYLDWNVISNLKRPENKDLKFYAAPHPYETTLNIFLEEYSPGKGVFTLCIYQQIENQTNKSYIFLQSVCYFRVLINFPEC